jgi:hypothetical protein
MYRKMMSELFFLACGMYIGKYYPEYVPFPRIRQEYVDAMLAYLKSTPAAANEIKHE